MRLDVLTVLVAALAVAALTGCAALTPTATPAPTPTERPTPTATLIIKKPWQYERDERRQVVRVGCSTESMAPAISCGDKVAYWTEFDPSEIEVGDVVVFRLSASSDWSTGRGCSMPLHIPREGVWSTAPLIVHRVVAIQSTGEGVQVRTQGDNNPLDDGCWIPAGNLEGVVTEVW